MMRTLQGFCAVAATVALISAIAAPLSAVPKPSLVPKSWDLQFSHSEPRPISIKQLDGSTKWFWYITYKVINETGEDQQWVPEITVLTDRGQIAVAGRGVPATVFSKIFQKERNELLEHPDDVVGKLLQGDDYARESVAIWPAFEEDADHLSIFVGGVSGETAVVPDPRDNSKEVVLQKTYQVDYFTPGTDVHPQDQTVTQTGSQYVMR